MSGWTPIHSKITNSSVWDEPNHVRLAWISILVTTDKHGICPIKTAKGLAALARLTLEEATDALSVLSNPDVGAPKQDFEGRRIEMIPNDGIFVLNWEKYRMEAKSAKTRESNRVAQEESRARRKLKEAANTPPPDDGPPDTEPDIDNESLSYTGRPLK